MRDTDTTTVQDPAMYDVDGFCEAHNFGRAKLYELWAEGRGPARVKVGRRTLIPGEAAAAWRRQMLREQAGGDAEVEV